MTSLIPRTQMGFAAVAGARRCGKGRSAGGLKAIAVGLGTKGTCILLATCGFMAYVG